MRERYQNPVIGSGVRLRLFFYNANLQTNVVSVSKIDIYYLDKNSVSADNPDGRVLITTIDGSSVVNESTGVYYIDLDTPAPNFVQGNYIDVWTVTFGTTDQATTVENNFTIFPDLWYSTVIPTVYDFNFNFQPNRIVKGSKRYLIIEVVTSVPRATDLERYYTNLAILGDLTVSLAIRCGQCVPKDEDSRLIIDNDPVDYREKVYGYYLLDTDTLDLECGVYDIFFGLETGGNTYISEKQQLLIYS